MKIARLTVDKHFTMLKGKGQYRPFKVYKKCPVPFHMGDSYGK